MNQFSCLPAVSRIRSMFFRCMGLIVLLMFACTPLFATTWTVSNLNDSGTGSLRATVMAIIAAGDSGDTIQFQSGLSGVLTLTSGDILISGNTDLTIAGPGAGLVTLSSNSGSLDLFEVIAGSNLTLSGLSVENTNSNGRVISNLGSLTVSQIYFSGSNISGGNGGAIYNGTGATLTVQDCFFTNNSALQGGAIWNEGNASITRSTFAGNKSTGGSESGSAIGNTSSLFLTDDTFNGNSGDIDVYSTGSATVNNVTMAANAGGNPNISVGSGTLTLTNSILADGCGNCGSQSSPNQIGGGDTQLGPLEYNGGFAPTRMPLPGSSFLNAGLDSGLGADQRVFTRPSSGASDLGAVQTHYNTVSNLNDSGVGSLRDAINAVNSYSNGDIVFQSGLTGSIVLQSTLPEITGKANVIGPGATTITINGNNTSAGIIIDSSSSSTISGLTFSGAYIGSAVQTNTGANLAIDKCIFDSNTTSGSLGAALQNLGSTRVFNSTFSNNSLSGNGGAIFSSGLMTIANSTFSGNQANAGFGGAIENQNGSMAVFSSTISNNTATSGGSGIFSFSTTPVAVVNSIVSGNTSDNCSVGGCMNVSSSSLIDGTVALGPLAANGITPTVKTMIPLPGSSAIGAGNATLVFPGTTTDERGFPRLTNGQLDVGAAQTNYIGSVFTVQPSNTSVNTAISPAVQVAVQEKNTTTGDVDAVDGVSVTMSLSGAGNLTGTSLQTTTGGTASFNDLKIDTAGNSDVLVASVATLSDAVSNPFSMTLAIPTVALTTVPPANVTYGVAPISLSATSTFNGNPTGQTILYYVVSGPGTIPNGSNVLTIYGAGTVVVAAQAEQNGSYEQESVQATINVAPAALTVTAANATRTYGMSNPVFTGTVAGEVNGDTFNVDGTTTATTTTPVGTYTIVPTVQGGNGVFLTNYTVTYVNATLTITPATLTVNGTQENRPYGSPNPQFAWNVFGVENNDQFTVTGNTTATQSSPVGTYTVVPVVSGPQLSNYTLVVTNGSLNIIPELLQVVANNATRVYGTPNPAFTSTVTGAVLGDVFAGGGTAAATQTSDAGPYDITPTVTPTPNSNYAVVPTVGILTITQASTSLTLTASGTQGVAGSSVTFTAAIATPVPVTPTGTVVFYSDNAAIGASGLNAQGVATLTTSVLPPGSHVITAAYQETRDFTGSTAQLGQNIIIGTPTFSMTATPPSLNIIRGNVGSVTLTLTPTYGFNGAITFACNGLPAQSQCVFNPSNVTLSGASQTVALTIEVGPLGLKKTNPGNNSAHIAPVHISPATPLRSLPLTVPAILFWLPGMEMPLDSENRKVRKHRARGLLWIAILAVSTGLLGLMGCAGLSPLPNRNVVQPGPYTIMVTATGNGVTQTLPIQIQVQ